MNYRSGSGGELNFAELPSKLDAHDVGSNVLGPLVLPLLADVRSEPSYVTVLKDLLLDLTVRMARTYSRWYARSLADIGDPVTTR